MDRAKANITDGDGGVLVSAKQYGLRPDRYNDLVCPRCGSPVDFHTKVFKHDVPHFRHSAGKHDGTCPDYEPLDQTDPALRAKARQREKELERALREGQELTEAIGTLLPPDATDAEIGALLRYSAKRSFNAEIELLEARLREEAPDDVSGPSSPLRPKR